MRTEVQNYDIEAFTKLLESTDCAEERTNLLGQGFRLLKRWKMSSPLHCCPSCDISVHVFRQRTWRPQELFWKVGVTAGHLDALSRGYHPRAMHPRIIRPEA